MKSFDEHFKGAKNHNQEDLKWLLACYYGTMMNLCNEYSYLGDEDLFGLMLEWFWWDWMLPRSRISWAVALVM